MRVPHVRSGDVGCSWSLSPIVSFSHCAGGGNDFELALSWNETCSVRQECYIVLSDIQTLLCWLQPVAINKLACLKKVVMNHNISDMKAEGRPGI